MNSLNSVSVCMVSDLLSHLIFALINNVKTFNNYTSQTLGKQIQNNVCHAFVLPVISYCLNKHLQLVLNCLKEHIFVICCQLK